MCANSGYFRFPKPNPGLAHSGRSQSSPWSKDLVRGSGHGGAGGAAELWPGDGKVGERELQQVDAGQGAKACGCRELGREGREGRVAV